MSCIGTFFQHFQNTDVFSPAKEGSNSVLLFWSCGNKTDMKKELYCSLHSITLCCSLCMVLPIPDGSGNKGFNLKEKCCKNLNTELKYKVLMIEM